MPQPPKHPALTTLTHDYTGWLMATGVDRLVDVGGADLDDPAVFAAVVERLFLSPYRLAFLDRHERSHSSATATVAWAELLAAFVSATHAETLEAVRSRTILMAASLDGSHAGGCG